MIIRWQRDNDYWTYGFDSDGKRIAVIDGPASCKNLTLNGVKYEFDSIENAIKFSESVIKSDAQKPLEKRPMLKEIGTDLKGFISENRTIIYWMAVLFLLDHFFFNGSFLERLKGLMERMIGRVEKHIDKKL